MKNSIRTGIWIDHKTALLVWPGSDGSAKTAKIESGFEGKERKAGNDTSYMHGGTHYMDETGFENRQKERLKIFYNSVMDHITENAELFIFGPASAKREFSKAIRENKTLNAKIISVETAARMTDNQVIAKVREYFELAL